MGLFTSDDGLYRGDAPVSMPGTGGAAPRAYSTAGADEHSQIKAAEWAAMASSKDRPGIVAEGKAARSVAPSGAGDRSSMAIGVAAMLVIVGIVVWFVWGAMGGEDAQPATNSAVSAVDSQGRDEASLGERDMPKSEGDVSNPESGSVPFVGDARQADDPNLPDGAGDSVGAGGSDGAGDLSASASDDGLTLDFADASLNVVVYRGSYHAHGLWQTASAGSPPAVVVRIAVTRLDDGANPVSLDRWNWRLDTTDGENAWATTIGAAQPNAAVAELRGGESVSGYLTFLADGRAATIALTEGIVGDTLATWEFTAWMPEVIDAAFDDMIEPEVGWPSFAIGVTSAATDDANDPRFSHSGTSGRYLTFNMSASALDGTAGPAGYVSTRNFVLVTAGGDEIEPTYGVIGEPLGLLAVVPGMQRDFILAFDTAQTSGTLVLRDGAGQPVVRWPFHD